MAAYEAMKRAPWTAQETQKPGTELPDTDLRLPPTLPPTPPHTQPSSEKDSEEFDLERTLSNDLSCQSRSSSTSLDLSQYFPLAPISEAATEVLSQDKNTPDSWVPRDPRLIRLTGIHPFNVEPPLTDLYNQGFITSQELFYVRNHGAVPQVHDEDMLNWEFSVEGMVEKPFTMTLKQMIEEFEQVTMPITLVCAGNRRKEQNQVRKSKGFSWGAAGVSNALWTGVPICELLKRAKPARRAKYVCMEGADKLPNGYYGTNVKLNWAMDPNRGILMAHKVNGEALTPDHGRPLRVIVPGQIGGRSVKWIKKIIVTEQHSDNWYHIYDNRVLPTMVSPEQSAEEPKWWTDERYAIYDLSTNSATAFPAHDERLSLSASPRTYKVKGYAYGGGGRRIARVEITLDKGKSWRLANITYHEDMYRDFADENQMLYGGRLDCSWRETCFAWCFWDLDIDVDELAASADIMVRAMDESMNVQPRDMYWSVLGMMNNPWFRITITKEEDELHFEHPTQPALMPGGWMEKVKKAGGNLSNGFWGESMGGVKQEAVAEVVQEIKMTRDDVKRQISIEELRAHEGVEEPWFVLNDEVFDGTPFLEGHPGGATSITGAAGQDATEEFMAIHSENAKGMMTKYHIGSLDVNARKILSAGPVETTSTEPRPIFLQPKSWTKALLTTKKVLSWDTRLFTFALDHPTQEIGLPTGQHVMMRLRDSVTKEAIIRSYTPMSQSTQLGTLDILIKVYFDSKERPGGKMTKALDKLDCGEFVDFKGPVGHFEYLGRGQCEISHKKRTIKKFIMICGGSGITPIFQVLRAVLQDQEDVTKCLVLNGNRLEEDILCRSELDDLVKLPGCEGDGGKVKLIHTLTKASDEWTGLRGRVGKELLEKEVGEFGKSGFEAGEELVLICGPEALEKACHKALNELGWADEYLLFF